MAGIGYPYVSAVQDLWLYEPRTVTWNSGSSSGVFEYPIAWNPGSPLYGYRASLQGISLRWRIATASAATYLAPALYAAYAAINNPATPANKWAFFNCYPMPLYAVSKKFCWTCAHCFGASGERNPTRIFRDTVFGPETLNDKLMVSKWMNKDNQITDTVQTDQMLPPFNVDTPQNFRSGFDLSLTELHNPLSFNPLTVVDVRSLRPGSTMWYIDSAMKIIRFRMDGAGVKRRTVSSSPYSFDRVKATAMLPDGSAVASAYAYLHDSGSVFLAEIQPPSSPTAGDGVLGLVPWHQFLGGQLGETTDHENYGEFTAYGYQGSSPVYSNVRNYMSARFFPMPPAQKAKRQHSDLLLVSTLDRLVEKVNSITVDLTP